MKKTTLKLSYLAVLLFLCTTISYAQRADKCATDALNLAQRQKNPSFFDNNREQLESFTRKYAQNKKQLKSAAVTVTVKIPTIIHVIHNGEAIGTYPNISDKQILSAIANLNDAFQNQGSVYGSSAFYNNPMNIEFVLAKIKEDGTATTGIERHDVSSKAYGSEYHTNGIKSESIGVDSDVLFKDYYYNPQDYMNIWVVNKIEGVDVGTTGNGTLGYASLPTNFAGVSDNLVCQARAFGYYPSYNPNNPSATPDYDFGTGPTNASGNGTADHEVGHYLNLLHTFTGDNNGTSCPGTTNTIGVDSDGCDDIAPHIRTDSNCPDYSATANTCVAGGGPNDYIHNFMNYSSDPCFQGFSNDQRTRVNATLDGPRVAFKTSIANIAPSGSYPATLTVMPKVTNQGQDVMGIFEVNLNGNTYKSISAYNDGFYLNRVASQPTTNLLANTAYNMKVKVGVGSAENKELVNVFIDYNNNGTFDSNEMVYQTVGGAGKNNGGIFDFNFTTPHVGNFTANQRLRMRVISYFDEGSTVSNPNVSDYGNIEDYSVLFETNLSVGSIEKDYEGVNVYPNPTDDVLNINNTSNNTVSAISIFDTLGKLVFKGSNANKIFVGNLERGRYFIKIEFTNSEVVSKSFIKK
ncbi:zinc-dependent metalloprotease [Flavobacterium sp. 7A]|uniref:zinc-dependent metalloprotease n=1 Tax=Flavobacterium sp. 7A TaxID=2940571 RepID=UPI0022275F8B|nr:zinc-dependent metalloprotease [Flavobacterium sp. 7A]MCW2120612.1 hypothetical protein [Flavobacterium sp. 7A]